MPKQFGSSAGMIAVTYTYQKWRAVSRGPISYGAPSTSDRPAIVAHNVTAIVDVKRRLVSPATDQPR
jgi:hypothetical protein